MKSETNGKIWKLNFGILQMEVVTLFTQKIVI